MAQESTELVLASDAETQEGTEENFLKARRIAAQSLKPFARTNPVAQHFIGSNLIATAASNAETCAGLNLLHASALAGYPAANVGMAMYYLGLSNLNEPSGENFKLAYFWAREADRRDNGPTEISSDLFVMLDRSVKNTLDEEWAEWKPINSPIRTVTSNCN